MDLLDGQSVRDLADHARPDVVIHTAYARDVPEMDAVIVSGTEVLAAACDRVGARPIFVSSDAVFSGNAGRAYTEADPVDPLTAYGRAKARAEEAVLDRCPEATVVRTSLLIGPPAYPGHQVRRAQAPDATYWMDIVRCPIHVDDLAAVLIELAENPRAGVLHVAGPEAMSRQTIAEPVTGRPWIGPLAPEGTARDVRLDSSVATSELRTPIRNVRATLAEHQPGPAPGH